MSSIKRVLVIGGGIGGLSAAIAMHKQGIQVEIVEINAEWKVYHVGIVVQGNFIRALASLGLGQQVIDAGFPYKGARMCDMNGNVVAEIPGYPMAGPNFPSDLGLTRPALHKVLTDAVKSLGIPYRLGVTFTDIVDEGSFARVKFTDNTSSNYDLVVGADGVYSKVRAKVFGEQRMPKFTGQGVWRYNIPRQEGLEWAVLYKGKKGGTAGYIPLDPKTMYVFMVNEEPGNPRFPVETQADELRKRLEGYGGYMATVRDQITDPSLVVYRPLEAIIMPAPWYKGRVALIGDAVHSATPHLGQGAAMAVEDAVVLGEELGRDGPVEGALERFMARRFERAKFVGESSIQLGEWEQRPTPEADSIGLYRKVLTRLAEPI